MSGNPSTPSTSNLDGADDSDDELDITADTPLVGAVGQSYVQRILSHNDPLKAIQLVQSRAGLTATNTKPLLGLLDQVGITRCEAHQYVLAGAKAQLVARLAVLPTHHLVTALHACFPYVRIPALREIPLAVLARLHPVPAAYLKQLAEDTDLFGELPLNVQQQVWEMDKKRLMQHVAPVVATYPLETGTVLMALNMGLCLSAAPTKPPQGSSADALPQKAQPDKSQLARLVPTRRNVRGFSPGLTKLVKMIGNSALIHKAISEFCAARLRDSESLYLGVKECGFCTLRSQLTMRLHDAESTTDMAKLDEVHQLAWLLDACIKERGIDAKKMPQLMRCFQEYERSGGAFRSSKRKREMEDEDALSQGPTTSGNQFHAVNRGLIDAALVLRDPASLHLLIFQVLRELQRVMTKLELPAQDENLVFLTRLIQLAVHCRTMLRDRQYVIPLASHELLHTFYPLLGQLILAHQLPTHQPGNEGPGKPDQALVKMLQRDEIVRKVTQMYTLERLAAGDLWTTCTLLASLSQALEGLSDRALPEWGAFAHSLAQQLGDLIACDKVSIDSQLWCLAVEGILIRCCDSESQVHEEVLRLLISAVEAGLLVKTERLAAYLERTIQHSKKSRKRFKKMLQEEQLMMEENPGDCSGGYASTGGNTWSGNGTEGGGGAKGAETGVAPLYLDFLNLVPALRNRDLVPLLHQFLEEGQHLQVPQPTMPTGGADKGHPPPSLPAEAAAP